MMCHESLGNMIQTNFIMMKQHEFSLTEIENMMP